MKDVTDFPVLSVEERTTLFSSIMLEKFSDAEIDSWTEDRYALEALSCNDTFHGLGFHADFKPGLDALRLRVILKVSDIRDAAGPRFTDRDVIDQFIALFPDTEVMDLDFDGTPHLCFVGNWDSVGVRNESP